MLPNLTCIFGQFGSGKSLYQLELGLKMCEDTHKPLLCNFPLNHSWVRKYCLRKGYKWFAACGRIIHLDIRTKGIDAMMRPNTVVLFDECGISLNARDWGNLSPKFRTDLYQIRHLDIHMICAFQFVEQVDKTIRECCQHWVICEGVQRYDKELKKPRLYARFAYHYNTEKFERIQFDVKMKTNGLQKWMNALKVKWSLLSINSFFSEVREFLALPYYFRDCYLSKKMIDWEAKYLTDEFFLFKCYDSGLDFKGDKRVSVTSRVVYVSDGLEAPQGVRVIKRSKARRVA